MQHYFSQVYWFFSCLSTVCFLLLYRFSYDCFFHPSTSVKFPFESVLTFWGIVFGSCGGCLKKCVNVYWIADSTGLFDTLFKHGGKCWINWFGGFAHVPALRRCWISRLIDPVNQCLPAAARFAWRVHKAFGIEVNMLNEHSWPGLVACVSLHLMS